MQEWLCTLALCRFTVLSSSGSGGIGYGYFLLEAIDPVDEEGDLAGDRVLRCREYKKYILCHAWYHSPNIYRADSEQVPESHFH